MHQLRSISASAILLGIVAAGCASVEGENDAPSEDSEDTAATEEQLAANHVRIQATYTGYENRCLAGSLVANARVNGDYCASSHADQGWRLAGLQLISQLPGTARCLGTIGSAIYMRPCNIKDTTQHWRFGAIEKIGSYTGRRLKDATGRCLTLSSTGAAVMLTCGASVAQLWGTSLSPSNELAIPSGVLSRIPNGRLKRYVASPQTIAATDGQIRFWDVYQIGRVVTSTPDRDVDNGYECGMPCLLGNCSARHYVRFNIGGVVLVAVDASGNSRARVAFASTNETCQHPLHFEASWEVLFANGAGDYARFTRATPTTTGVVDVHSGSGTGTGSGHGLGGVDIYSDVWNKRLTAAASLRFMELARLDAVAARRQMAGNPVTDAIDLAAKVIAPVAPPAAATLKAANKIAKEVDKAGKAVNDDMKKEARNSCFNGYEYHDKDTDCGKAYSGNCAASSSTPRRIPKTSSYVCDYACCQPITHQ